MKRSGFVLKPALAQSEHRDIDDLYLVRQKSPNENLGFFYDAENLQEIKTDRSNRGWN